jgi:glycosyl transferase family 25
VRAYVINLARSPDRRTQITAEIDKTGFGYEFMEAVDGRELDLNDARLVDRAVVDNSSFRGGAGVPGTVACALSHLRVFRKVLEDKQERALVLEDDVSMPSDLATLVDSVGKHMFGAEVVLLNFHNSGPCRVTKKGAVRLPSSRLIVDPVDTRHLTSAGAYVITREACVRMERFVLPVRAHPDDWDVFCREGVIDRVRCVVPMPVSNNTTLRTTIDRYRPGSLQARVLESVTRVRVPVLYQILTYRRKRIFRKFASGKYEFVEDALD